MSVKGLSRRVRLLVVVGVLAAYVVVYFPLAAKMGASASSLFLFPVVVAGWCLGARGAAVFTLVAWPINHVLIALSQGAPIFVPRASDLMYIPLTVGMGATVGYLSDLRAKLERNEAALREGEARMRGLIENAPLTVIMTDVEGAITFANRPREVAHISDWVPQRRRELEEILSEVTLHGVAIQRELAVAGADGETWISIKAGPLRGEDDERRGTVFVIMDVTGRKVAETALRQADKLASLGTLVAGVAHEINNPLTYMRGNLEIAQLDLDDALRADDPGTLKDAVAQAAGSLPSIGRGIDRIEEITRSLHRIAAPQRGQRKLTTLDAIADGVVKLFATQVPGNVQLDVQLGSRRGVLADEQEIGQLALNLLINALDAVGKRGSGGCIRVRTRDTADGVVLEVADDGPWIDEGIRGQIFTPFLTTKDKGTGLGLSIGHRIAEDHGGDLSFESVPGHGATFRLRLPIAQERVHA